MTAWKKVLFPWLRDREIIEENKLMPVKMGLDVEGNVMAVGFFTAGKDSERNLDFFVCSADKKKATVYSLNSRTNIYEASEVVASADEGYEIYSLNASDFNHDGHLDLLISQRLKDSSTETIHHRLFFGDGESLKSSGWTIPASKDSFLLFDWRGRMLVDFLGVPARSGSSDGKLKVWKALSDDPLGLVNGYEIVDLEDSCVPVDRQSHAFADFDGDGFADLLLICRGSGAGKKDHLKLLISDTKNSFSPSRSTLITELPENHGPISLGDFNADGSLDLIYAVCDPPESCDRENSIHVLLNTQRPFCTKSGQKNCKVLVDIMESDSSFEGFRSEDRIIIPVDRQYRLDAKIPLVIGDFNVNGFPDVLAAVDDTVTHTKHIILLENVSDKAVSHNRVGRSLSRCTRGTEELEKIDGVTGMAFLNLYQDGPQDIIVNYFKDGVARISALQNGFVQDAFFMRAEALNGVCPSPCMSKNTGSSAARPYGASFPGPTVKFSFTDFDGSLRIRSASQLPQSGLGRVSTPFSFFGLGRTNNFVELLTVRTPSRISPNLAKKAGLVPNSDLIINSPHADSQNSFHFELHILPGQYFLWVLISIGTAMLVLGALTAYFKWREIKEDNEERRKAIHSINFDAL